MVDEENKMCIRDRYMFIHEMFQQKPCVFSVEVFPPKKAGAAEETLYQMCIRDRSKGIFYFRIGREYKIPKVHLMNYFFNVSSI